MTLPKYKDLNNLVNISDIDKEIFLLQKNLFDLRIKRSTNQTNKPHLFTHTHLVQIQVMLLQQHLQ